MLERSSKGKGTRTTLCLVKERISVLQRVDVLFRRLKVAEHGISSRCSQPFVFVYSFGQGVEHNDSHSHRAGDRQSFVEPQPMVSVNRSGRLYCRHGGFHICFPFCVSASSRRSIMAKSNRHRGSLTQVDRT